MNYDVRLPFNIKDSEWQGMARVEREAACETMTMIRWVDSSWKEAYEALPLGAPSSAIPLLRPIKEAAKKKWPEAYDRFYTRGHCF